MVFESKLSTNPSKRSEIKKGSSKETISVSKTLETANSRVLKDHSSMVQHSIEQTGEYHPTPGMTRAITDQKLIFTPNLNMLKQKDDYNKVSISPNVQFRRHFNQRGGSVLVTPVPQKTRFDMNFPKM